MSGDFERLVSRKWDISSWVSFGQFGSTKPLVSAFQSRQSPGGALGHRLGAGARILSFETSRLPWTRSRMWNPHSESAPCVGFAIPRAQEPKFARLARCLDAPRRGTRVFRRSFDAAVRGADRLDRVFDFQHPASEQKRAVKNTLSEPFRFLEPLQKWFSFSIVSAETTSKLTDFPGALPKSLQSQTPMSLAQARTGLAMFPSKVLQPF